MRLKVILREVFRYVTLSAVLTFIFSVMSKFIHPLNLWQFCPAIILLGCLVGLFMGFRIRITPVQAAMVADLRGNTGERLTAYFGSQNDPTVFNVPIESDAIASAKVLKPQELVPYHIPRTTRYLILILILVVGMIFVPEFKYPSQARHEQNVAELEETTKTLKNASALLEKVEKTNPEIEELKKDLEELRTKLKKGEIDRKKALAEIGKVSEELQKQLRETYIKKAQAEKTAKELAKKEETSGLAEAMKKNDKDGMNEETAKIRKRIEQLHKEMMSEDSERREQAQKKMEELINAVKAAGEKAGADKGQKMPEELAEALSALDGLDKLSLDKLGGDISKELLDKFEKNLPEGLSKMLEGQQFSKEDLEKMMKALEKMAKAEAETLCGPSGEG